MTNITVVEHKVTQPKVKALFYMIQSDLQSRKEGQQRVHPGASGKQRFVDVDI